MKMGKAPIIQEDCLTLIRAFSTLGHLQLINECINWRFDAWVLFHKTIFFSCSDWPDMTGTFSSLKFSPKHLLSAAAKLSFNHHPSGHGWPAKVDMSWRDSYGAVIPGKTLELTAELPEKI